MNQRSLVVAEAESWLRTPYPQPSVSPGVFPVSLIVSTVSITQGFLPSFCDAFVHQRLRASLDVLHNLIYLCG